jgi:hypothetical protein
LVNVLTTPAEGMCILGIVPLHTRLIRWHNTTPSAREAGRSSGKVTLSLPSNDYKQRKVKLLRNILRFKCSPGLNVLVIMYNIYIGITWTPWNPESNLPL